MHQQETETMGRAQASLLSLDSREGVVFITNAKPLVEGYWEKCASEGRPGGDGRPVLAIRTQPVTM